MGNIHVSCTLDEDLQICRYIDFIELVEMLKFGRMHIEQANELQRSRLLTAAAAWRRSVSSGSQSKNVSAAKTIRMRNRLLRGWTRGNLALQSWMILGEDGAASWQTGASSELSIGIVSTPKRLAASLLVRDSTSVVIGAADELALQDEQNVNSPYSLTGKFTPNEPAETVGIVANAIEAHPEGGLPHSMGLQVILPTLLARVIVAPYATERFVDLVTELVRENTYAAVTRADEAPTEKPRARAARKIYPPPAIMTNLPGRHLAHSHCVTSA